MARTRRSGVVEFRWCRFFRLEGWKVGRLEGWKVGRLEGAGLAVLELATFKLFDQQVAPHKSLVPSGESC